jgi:predicted nucleic acid-binding Zn finger protein
MKKPSEIDMLRKVCEEAKAGGKITGAHFSELSEAFGSRFVKAWETLKDGRVKKYVFKPSGRIVWIVVGKRHDYLVMPAAEFCTCDDFYFRVMDREAHLCYHLIAQKLAEALNWYDLVEGEDELYESLMKEWKRVTP